MRKILFCLSFILAFCLAPKVNAANDIIVISDISQATSNSTVAISSAGAGVRNCLTDFDIVSDSSFTLTIQDGGVNIYKQIVQANTDIPHDFNPRLALCGQANQQMRIIVSAGNYNINYRGFTY